MKNSLIQTYFDYCSVAWEGLGSKLAGLQNRATRIITISSYDSKSGPFLQELEWDELYIRRILKPFARWRPFHNNDQNPLRFSFHIPIW